MEPYLQTELKSYLEMLKLMQMKLAGQTSKTSGPEHNQAVPKMHPEKLPRRSMWPPLYEAEVRMWSAKHKELQNKKIAFLLPHEVLLVLSEIGSLDTMVATDGLDAHNKGKHGEIMSHLQAPFVSLSLWGDGVPYSWDRKKSVDIWTLSFPRLSLKAHRDLRITLTAVPHEGVRRETQDDIMSILAWSFSALALGLCPTARHDGTDSEVTEAWRRSRGGQKVLHAAVLEVKGDWKQMHFCFGIPGWMSSPEKPICWRCLATKQSLKDDSGPEALWLQPGGRLTHHAALLRILEDGGSLSSLWSVPWVTMGSLRIDWLHVADQGVTPVFLGGLFHLSLADKSLGANEGERCTWLWEQIQAFYRDNHTEDKLHDLTLSMIKPKKASIELAGSGAQVRALVPFGLQLVESWTVVDDEHVSARECMRDLAKCYGCLRSGADVENFLGFALGF